MKNQRKSSGFTLVETLVSLVILVMLISVVSVGVDTAMRAYQSITFASESDLLSSTIQSALSDILRFAVCEEGEAGEDSGQLSITNESYGLSKGSLFLDNDNGRIMVNSGGTLEHEGGDTFFLVNDGAYTSMKISNFTLKYENGLFSGSYTIESANGRLMKTKDYAFRTLKAK